MKRPCVYALLAAFILSFAVAADSLADTAAFIKRIVPSAQNASVGGEWALIGLVQSDETLPVGFTQHYYETLRETVNSKGAVLHGKKRTENARAVLALTALGKSPYSVGGADILSPLNDYAKVLKQGLNGPVWALIALDSASYAGTQREAYLSCILDAQLPCGGFALAGKTAVDTDADVDLTAMVLTALSPYQSRTVVKTAVAQGLGFLSSARNAASGYDTAESVSQVIIALNALGVPLTDARFSANGQTLADALAAFSVGDGSYRHSLAARTYDPMATEQALLALVSLKTVKSPYTLPLSRLSDASDAIKRPTVKTVGKTFSDVRTASVRVAVSALSARGIINGRTETAYAPDDSMTRAEFAAVITRALGLAPAPSHPFDDVPRGAWYENAVNAAYRYGVTSGTSANTFSPDGTITCKDAYTMLSRVAVLCGMDTDVLPSVREHFSKMSGFAALPDYAKTPLAFCLGCGITEQAVFEEPNVPITRAEIAVALYRLLERSALL